MGMEFLIKALLNALGYTQAQFEEAISYAKTEFDAFRNRAIDSEKRLFDIAEQNRVIIENQTRIINLLEKDQQNVNLG